MAAWPPKSIAPPQNFGAGSGQSPQTRFTPHGFWPWLWDTQPKTIVPRTSFAATSVQSSPNQSRVTARAVKIDRFEATKIKNMQKTKIRSSEIRNQGAGTDEMGGRRCTFLILKSYAAHFGSALLQPSLMSSCSFWQGKLRINSISIFDGRRMASPVRTCGIDAFRQRRVVIFTVSLT